MARRIAVHMGVDVGGTNTDAVVLCKGAVVTYSKSPTTKDVTSGICHAVKTALLKCRKKEEAAQEIEVLRIHIGTTHFVNAVAQKQDLAPVAVVRLCQPASTSLPPFSDFPQDLQKVMGGPVYMISGGYYFDGTKEISSLKRDEVKKTFDEIKAAGIKNVVVSGLFSPVNNQQEIQVREWAKEFYPEVSVTLSHTIAQLDLLHRENSAIINESLKPLAHKTVDAMREAFNRLNLHCPFYLSQNDGTLLSSDKVREMPVLTFASGPTNSMRGAAYLSGVSDGIVVDIGGTTTDAGMLINGFPRQSSTKVEICRVKTNFQMPDTVTIALGGGSLIRFVEGGEEHKVMVGPSSVGYNLLREGIVFGGHALTATDIAVAADLADVGSFQDQLTTHYLPDTLIKEATDKIHDMVENLVDSIKTSQKEVPVILVGGGTILISDKWKPAGISEVLKPPYYDVANAVGAALSQVSGSVDTIENILTTSREEAIEEAKQRAIDLAVKQGADPQTVEIVSLADIPLTYIPGSVHRIQVKAIGDLKMESETSGVLWSHHHGDSEPDEVIQDEDIAAQSHRDLKEVDLSESDEDIPAEDTPYIDAVTGEWQLSIHDVKCLEIGTGIMGCGGGGNPFLGAVKAVQVLQEGKKIRVINPERFCKQKKPDDVVLPIAFMGAPTAFTEMVFNMKDLIGNVQAAEDLYGYDEYSDDGNFLNKENFKTVQENGVTFIQGYNPKHSPEFKSNCSSNKLVALCPAECGGSNAMVPLFVGGACDIVVLDCDLMGRAFPELQMVTTAMNNVSIAPGFLTDIHSERWVITKADNAKAVERKYRDVCVQTGCMTALGWGSIRIEQLLPNVVMHSLSRAWRLGEAVLNARKNKTSTIEAILHFAGGILLFTAKIVDVERVTEGGFAKGRMILEGSGDFSQQTFLILFQNENLVAKSLPSRKTLAVVPDLITLVDNETGEPISTDETRYGLRVAALALPAPPILTTPHALKVVGPQAFGYDDETYTPVGEYVQHSPIPPL